MIREELFTHEYLWRCSTQLIEALPKEEPSYHLVLPGQIMTITAFEAFVNFCGHALLPEVWADEREQFRGKGIADKIQSVSECLPEFEWKKGENPYQGIRELLKLRDFVVHGKVHASTYEPGDTAGGLDFKFELPWESYLTVDSLLTARGLVFDFSQSMVVAARRIDGHHLHFLHDAYSGPLGSGTGSAPYDEPK